jgi:transcriptional regulator with XRE-family HTH domain
MIDDTTAERLRIAREAAGLSLRQAAKVEACSHVWLGEMERAARALPTEWAVRLARLYDVSLDWLLTGAERAVDPDLDRQLAKLSPADAEAIRHLVGRLRAKEE